MTTRNAQKLVSLTITPIPFTARRASLRSLSGIFNIQFDPILFTNPLNTHRRGPIKPVRESPKTNAGAVLRR